MGYSFHPLQLSDLGLLGLSGAMIVLMIYLIAQSLPNRRQRRRKSDDAGVGGGGGAFDFDARHYRMDLRHRRFRVNAPSNLGEIKLRLRRSNYKLA